MKALFLDIDGVLNSQRSCHALGGYPHGFDELNMAMFDLVAIGLIRRVCQKTGCVIILSSSWRIIHSVQDCANGLSLPVIDRTLSLPGPARRGDEIAAYLQQNPSITQYAIVDDDSDIMPEQLKFFVQTDGREGLLWDDYERLLTILGSDDEKARTEQLTADTEMKGD